MEENLSKTNLFTTVHVNTPLSIDVGGEIVD